MLMCVIYFIIIVVLYILYLNQKDTHKNIYAELKPEFNVKQ